MPENEQAHRPKPVGLSLCILWSDSSASFACTFSPQAEDAHSGNRREQQRE